MRVCLWSGLPSADRSRGHIIGDAAFGGRTTPSEELARGGRQVRSTLATGAVPRASLAAKPLHRILPATDTTPFGRGICRTFDE